MKLDLVTAIDSQQRTIWIVDADRGGKRFIVRADEILTAFLELESAIRAAMRLAAARFIECSMQSCMESQRLHRMSKLHKGGGIHRL